MKNYGVISEITDEFLNLVSVKIFDKEIERKSKSYSC